jgi:hypothetical protein
VNRNKLIALIAALAVGVILFYWLRPKGNTPSVEFSTERLTSKHQPNEKAEPKSHTSIGTTNFIHPRWKVETLTEEQKEYLKRLPPDVLQRDPEADWKAPINFFGKVVDENGRPIEGVLVKFEWTSLDPQGHSEHQTYSDKNGRFSLTDVRGKRLIVSVEKEGYHWLRQGRRFGFEFANTSEDIFHKPDASNPVTFHLKKIGETEPLIKRYSKIPISKDGKPVLFNLFNGKVSENGQLKIQMWRSENRDTQNRFDWKLVISVPGGGLQETSEEFPALAPEKGYVEELELNVPASLGANWAASLESQAYVVFGNPKKYARISFRARPTGQHFFMDYWLNPSGSRNLEFDPAKQINKDQ